MARGAEAHFYIMESGAVRCPVVEEWTYHLPRLAVM